MKIPSPVTVIAKIRGSLPSLAKIPEVIQVMSSETKVEKNRTINKFITED